MSIIHKLRIYSYSEYSIVVNISHRQKHSNSTTSTMKVAVSILRYIYIFTIYIPMCAVLNDYTQASLDIPSSNKVRVSRVLGMDIIPLKMRPNPLYIYHHANAICCLMMMVWIVRAVMMTSMMARHGRRFLCSYVLCTSIVHHFDGKLFNNILEETRVIQSRFLAFIRIYKYILAQTLADTQVTDDIQKHSKRSIYFQTQPNRIKIKYIFFLMFMSVYNIHHALIRIT